MNLFINKSAKKIMLQLLLIMIITVVVFQAAAYTNALYLKNLMVAHDFELAGYLERTHPELSSEIQAAFTKEKQPEDMEIGRKLLEQAGYKDNMEIFLLPKVNSYYSQSMATYLLLTVMLGFIALLATFLFLKSHFETIDSYSEDIERIMEGNTLLCLGGSEEGSLSKLAAAINIMTSSLYAHIEKEKQSRAFMKDILENVSHQLKTPLSALTMYNEIMRDEEPENDVITTFLAKSVNELERMQTLITNLLKLARLDAGIIELNKKCCSLTDIIGQAAESFETRLQREGKTIEIKTEKDIFYSCDREWMLEAVSNLMKNAVEHTEPGDKIRILIEETALLLKISVEDNGEGIHPEDINHIFKRFYRSRFSQNKQGTGIGLTLAKTVVEMHGGFISVDSTLGKSTNFIVNLPIYSENKS